MIHSLIHNFGGMISARISSKDGIHCVVNDMSVLSLSPSDMATSIYLTSVEIVDSSLHFVPIKTSVLEPTQILQEIQTSPASTLFIIQIPNVQVPEAFLLTLEKLAMCTVQHSADLTTAFKTMFYKNGCLLWMSDSEKELQVVVGSSDEENRGAMVLKGCIQEAVGCELASYKICR